MKRVLITGGFGYVGGRLAKKLSGTFEVIVSTRHRASIETLALHGVTSQVTHQELLKSETFPQEIDTVIHMAALNEIDCVRLPSEAIRVNIDETRIILESAIAAGVSNFLYFSTAHIYGSPLQGEIDEELMPVPIHPYAITHKAAEDYVIAAGRQKRIKAIVLRLSNSFGAPVSSTVNRWTLLANDLCRQAIEKEEMQLLSNGCQYRDFMCLSDVANIVLRMCTNMQSCTADIYNVGAGVSMQVKEFAQLIADVYEDLFSKPINVQLPQGAVASLEPRLHYKIDRLMGNGFTVNNNFREEIRELLLFCKENFAVNA